MMPVGHGIGSENIFRDISAGCQAIFTMNTGPVTIR